MFGTKDGQEDFFMFDQIDIHSSVPVYEQIENHVRFALASGRLKGGDQLPSIKALMSQLGINPNTVAKAYRDLEVMGLVYTRRGMGVYIQENAEAQCRESVRTQVVGRLYEVVSEAKASGMSLKEARSCLEKLYASAGDPYTTDEATTRRLAKEK
jgi:GntR family transcriptional regulator